MDELQLPQERVGWADKADGMTIDPDSGAAAQPESRADADDDDPFGDYLADDPSAEPDEGFLREEC